MNRKSLEIYERSYLILIVFIMVQVFLVFLSIYLTQEFSIESFIIVIIQLTSIMLAYFMGLVSSAIFTISYVVGYIIYAITGEGSITLGNYISMFIVPITTIYAGNMNLARKRIASDLNKLNKLEEMQIKIDPNTHLENEYALKEILSRHCNLAKRNTSYYFSVYMFRLEFIDTLRTILEVRDFNYLIERIAEVIQNSIREEDYKFITKNHDFIIITPLTSTESIKPAIRRILEGVEKLNIHDRNDERVDIILKAGGLDYSDENYDILKEPEKLFLELQKMTEVDIYGEYAS